MKLESVSSLTAPYCSELSTMRRSLSRAGAEDIELMLVINRLRLPGRVFGLDGSRSIKAILHGELFCGSRYVGRPNMKVKDTCKYALKCGHVLDNWRNALNNRLEWRMWLIKTVEVTIIKGWRCHKTTVKKREDVSDLCNHSCFLCLTVYYPLRVIGVYTYEFIDDISRPEMKKTTPGW